jgi:hypothetical protein
MQLIALIISIVLNLVLLFIGSSQLLAKGDQGLEVFTYCAWTSAVLIIVHLAFCVGRMIVLWRRGRKEASLWGLVVLVLVPIGAYYLLGGYLMALLVVAGPIGGDAHLP